LKGGVRVKNKSAMQDDRQCLICGSEVTEAHHVFFGTANRRMSDKYGLIVYLCPDHHRGENGVHHNRYFDLMLKKEAQLVFEEDIGTHKEFMQAFGRNYL